MSVGRRSSLELIIPAGEMVGGLWHGNYPSGAGMMAGTVFGRISGTNAAKDALQTGV